MTSGDQSSPVVTGVFGSLLLTSHNTGEDKKWEGRRRFLGFLGLRVYNLGFRVKGF